MTMQGKSPMIHTRCFPKTGFVLAAVCALSPLGRADFRNEVDFTKLKAEYGSSLPDGAGIRVLQIEYPRNGYWAPQAAGDLWSKSFSYLSSTFGGYSAHANDVGIYLAGSGSMTPGINAWSAMEATAYTGRANLNGTRSLAPSTATWDIENHSWGGNDPIWATAILQKQDYRIDRDNVVAVVGVDNGSTMSMFMANGYNSIAVGVSNGNHPRSGTSMETTGRMKPDLVAPAPYTSYATPVVASGVSILLGEINRNGALSSARSPMVVKALVMAGATKAEFSGWSHTSQYPLDRTYGAGEFNIYNSYKALVAGKQNASATAEVALAGWDFNTSTTSARRLYFFSVPSGKKMTLSAVLTWHRKITPDALWTTMTSSLANLDLKLWRASNYSVGSLVSSSSSSIDNVEHIYETTLLAGQYALEVTAAVSNERYGIAWHSTLVDDGSVTPPVAPPPATPQPPVPVGSVTDASFESVSVGSNHFNAFAYNPSLNGWTFSSQSGLAGNNSGFTSGNAAAPSGSQVAFVQAGGSMATKVSLPAGSYSIAAKVANRGNYGGAQTVAVLINGWEVGRFAAGVNYTDVSTNTFSVGDGTHEIRFVGQTSGDCTLFLDQVNITSGSASVSVPVGSSGFEAPDLGWGNWSAYRYNPQVSTGSQDWQFDGASGVTGNGSGFTVSNPAAPEGKQVAFLQTNTSVMSQTVSFPAAGNYTLSVSAAQRANYNLSRQVVNVYLDGNYVGAISPSGTSYENLSVSFSAAAGARRISFQGTAWNDATVFIDAVKLTKTN
jgi:hypothetical protein